VNIITNNKFFQAVIPTITDSHFLVLPPVLAHNLFDLVFHTMF